VDTWSVEDVFLFGELACIADGAQGLKLIDVSDPAIPVILGSFDTDYATKIIVSAELTYVADGAHGAQDGDVKIINISDPTTPAFVGSIDTPGQCAGAAISGDTLLVADWKGMRTYDVASCNQCLVLNIGQLVGGQVATFTIVSGTPGAKAIIVYGFREGVSELSNVGGYCATFGIRGVRPGRIVGGVNRAFDDAGTIEFDLKIPIDAAGRSLLFQAAEQGTCPDECMSNIVEQWVQ